MDSSLVGLAKDANDDIIAGLTETGILTVVENGVQSVQRSKETNPENGREELDTNEDDNYERKSKRQKTS